MNRSLRAGARLAALVLVASCLAGCSVENRYNDEGDQIPRSDMEHTRPSTWEDAEVVDDTHIRVAFWGGLDECFGHDVEVKETAGTITISLSTGWLPRSEQVCNLPGVKYTTLVETSDPIGDREIIDGNAG